MPEWHQQTPESTLGSLRASSQGLTTDEARRRLAHHGPNQLAAGKTRSPLRMFLDQFADFMILVLLGAAVVSGLAGDLKDTLAILAILVLNAVIGFVQEYRAERAMEALKALAAPTAGVLRDGRVAGIPAADIVPGDIVLLEPGRVVPADLRLIEAARLKIEEAVLTGESAPVEKTTAALDGAGRPLGDRTNMAFKGTVVTYGRGLGVAAATGMATEFGKIAGMLQSAGEQKTPLQKRLAEFGKRLAIAAVLVCAVFFVAGLLRGEAPLLMFLTAVSLAVAAIPEALPAVVTVSLALGARKMAKQQALVRRLPAVETLGSVTYICSDKTGTLTLNRMRVEELACDGQIAATPGGGEAWHDLLSGMALCNDASFDASGAAVGDPTETALLAAARDAGAAKPALEQARPRVEELPFDSERKCMTTVHRDGGGYVSFTKGSVEKVLRHCTARRTASGTAPLDPDAEAALGERMAADGLRVLALATRRWPAHPEPMTADVVENELVFLGLAGLMDPPREEARQAVRDCRAAGIVPVMITGDHPATARSIAERLELLGPGDELMTGQELAGASEEALQARVERVRVYARVSPDQKLKIVSALQARGQYVAMTGDGVNDAPALKRADIGIAMGVTGTDVAKEASSLILLDDNFATIVRAVREGRRIYDNMRRFVRYALTTNAAELWTLLLAPFAGLPVPLLPIQILWINLVTDGLPGLALAAEPAERNVMQRPPRPPRESIFAHGLGRSVVWIGLLMAAVTIGCQAWAYHGGSPRWQTMVFMVLCLAQLPYVLAVRSERESLFTLGLGSNRFLLGAVILTLGLQLAAVYVPALNGVFQTQPLTLPELGIALAASLVPFAAVELEKLVRRRWTPST